MKRTRIMSILGIAIVLALLAAIVPVTPAFALSMALSPTTAQTGATVSISGSSFIASTTYNFFFSNQSATWGANIGTDVTVYRTVAQAQSTAAGGISATFTVPTTFSDNSAVTAGTHYIYACSTTAIEGLATLNVTAGDITLTPTTGPAFTAVQIIGSGFTSGATITATFSSVAVAIEGGNTTVQTNGSFISTIYVPASATVGAKTVSVTAGTGTATATFTVTASGALDPIAPTSGPAGIDVIITGANFPASTAIQFKFDTTILTPTSGDTVTRSGGVIISTITVPATAIAGSHTITVTVGSQTATATFTVTASAALDPIDPTSGPGGTDVVISGAHFPTSTALVFKFDTSTITPKSGDAATRSGGIFLSTVTIPAAATNGSHTITVTAGTGTATATFTVTGGTTPTPTDTNPLDVTHEETTNTIILTASGFTPNGGVTVYYNDVEQTSVNVGDSGILAVSLTPPTTHGDTIIKAVDMTDTSIIAQATYSVEEVPPTAPQPLLPTTGAEVKTDTTFDWGDSTDADSLPVTYDFQIATSTTFGEGTVLVDKTGLATSTYTMTEAERLNVASEATPYYWRARAVDAAENASDWTSSAAFYISGGTGLPSWAFYTILGIGAVILFGLGYWLGRRTAYYY